MMISPISFRSSAAATAYEMQATAGAYDSQVALINNARAQEALVKNADKMALEKLAAADKRLAMDRVELQTKLKIQEEQKKAAEEKRKKEAAKK